MGGHCRLEVRDPNQKSLLTLDSNASIFAKRTGGSGEAGGAREIRTRGTVNSDLTPSASYDPQDLVGTWTLVSVVTEMDGRKFDAYGQMLKACWFSMRMEDIQ
jgi:hypothetical protein